MKVFRALALVSASLGAMPVSAHEMWVQPVTLVVDSPVWVNPGVYVSQFSAVRRNYPYVGCCLAPRENWSLGRPYYAAEAMPPIRAAGYSRRSAPSNSSSESPN